MHSHFPARLASRTLTKSLPRLKCSPERAFFGLGRSTGAQGREEGVFVVAYFRLGEVGAVDHCYYVEAVGKIVGLVAEVAVGGARQEAYLARCDALHRVAVSVEARFHFHEDHRVVKLRDDVHLHVRAGRVPVHFADNVPFAAQIIGGQLLRLMPEITLFPAACFLFFSSHNCLYFSDGTCEFVHG